MNRLLLASVLLLLALMPVGAAAAQEAEPSFCVSAWYRESEQPGAYDSLMAHAGVIDIVHPMWYGPRDNGAVAAVDGAENPVKLAAWREAGLQIIPTIFSTLSIAIDAPDVRAVHVAAIVALVERMDYDGIDIDYEEFSAHTLEPFTDFIETLGAALHANGRQLSVTVMAKTDDAGWGGPTLAQDWRRLAAAADRFNIMTYDYTSRNQPPGPISPPEWVVRVLDYAATVTEIERVHFGMPFYGYSWQRGNPPARATTWESVQPWIASFGVEVMREPASGEAMVDAKPPGLPRQIVVYNDAASVGARLEAVLTAHPDVGGMSIFGLGGEDPAVWAMIAALRPADCASR